MKLGILFSGGKDSMYAAYLAKKAGYDLACLIAIESENKESFMFHTPSISATCKQAEAMNLPIILIKTEGKKEKELEDLERAIKEAKKKFNIKGIVTGAVESVYQSSRIQKICNSLNLEVFNPLWQKNQIELLEDIVKSKFEAIITGVFAYPLDEKWLGRGIDSKFIEEIKMLNKKWGISIAGEGGEFESFVLDCLLFKKRLEIKSYCDSGEGNSWRRELRV